MKDRLICLKSIDDIPEIYRNTPIGKLIEYHNFDMPHHTYETAQILIGMCMDNRKHMHIPDNFAFIIRSGGANLRYSEFKVSYAFAIGNVKYLALIGHNNCAMVNLISKKEDFIKGMIENAGWDRATAEQHYMTFAPMHEIENEIDFTLSEVNRLRRKYPKITVAPLYYLVEDGKIHFIKEE